jgi:conjugative relaxase-like TrwC/TraI family protein
MLRINQQKDANAARSYYTSKAEYYRGGQQEQELPGTWGGAAAERLGLDGEVAKAAFDALCDNRNPATGGKLTARDRKGRTVGYDFNFHVPKSLSLLYALAGDENILAAFRQALSLTLAEMEQAMQTRVRKAGQMGDRVTGNAVWRQHIHLTARPVAGLPDPHLHAHAFLFNATFDDVERQWKASKIADIYRDAPYYQAVFHAHLAKALADQGYPLEKTPTGWEIAGLASLLPKFSLRTAEIDQLAAERGISDPAVKDSLGAETRQRKQHDASMGELRRLWLARLDDGDRHALAALATKQGGSSIGVTADQAITLAIRHSFAKGHGLVPEKRLVAAALTAGIGTVTAEVIRQRLAAHGIVFRDYDGQRFCAKFDPKAMEADRRSFPEQAMQQQRIAAHERARATHAMAAPPCQSRSNGYGR